MKTKLVFVDGKEIELEVSEHSPLAAGLVWSVHMDIPRPKNSWTVIGVYVNVPPDDSRKGERFADHVYADTWDEAEDQVIERRGPEASIAAVVREHITVADEQ